MRRDFAQVPEKEVSVDDLISALLDLFEPKELTGLIAEIEPYVG
jgi:hypothetical protein